MWDVAGAVAPKSSCRCSEFGMVGKAPPGIWELEVKGITWGNRQVWGMLPRRGPG